MHDEALTLQIRQARNKFLAMSGAYFLGVFNDNFFKQAILLLAVSAGNTDMQGHAVAIFTLPFLVFAAPAGWLADRFAKRKVVIGAKWAELTAMLAGAAGICLGQYWLMLLMLWIMGTQATIFSPALNGSIPELYPESYVPKANGILRLIVTIAILAGIALAGIAMDQTGTGLFGMEKSRLAVASVIIGIAVVGLLVSFGVASRPAASPAAPFPWAGPVETFRTLHETRRDRMLALAIGADVFIWFAGSLQILLINPLGLQQFHLGPSHTSALIVAQMMGIGLGGMISARFIHTGNWQRWIGPCGAAMGLLMVLVALVPGLPAGAQVPVLYGLIGAIGTFGGLFLIPVESYVQVRPAPERKGAVLAAANFVIFAGILLSGPLSNLLNTIWRPTTGFGAVGLLSLAFSSGLIAIHTLRRNDAG